MSVRRRQWVSPSGERKRGLDCRLPRPARRAAHQDLRQEARRRHPSCHYRGRCPRRNAYRREPQRHRRGGGRAMAGEWQGGGAGAGDARRLRAAPELHIAPLIGGVKLAQLTVPLVRTFEDRLRQDRSAAMVRKVLRSLGAILADAQERGLVAQNVVHSLSHKRRGRERRAKRRQNGQLEDRRGHPDAGRDQGHRCPSRRTATAAVAHRDLRRATRQRASGSSMGGHRLEARRASCAPARRPLRQGRTAEVGGGRAHRAAAADGGHGVARAQGRQCASAMIAASSSPTVAAASITATPSSSAASIPRRSPPVSSIGRRRAKYQGPARAAPLLRLVVHQPARRWRAGTAVQDGAGAARPRLDPDDGGHLWPPVPAQR